MSHTASEKEDSSRSGWSAWSSWNLSPSSQACALHSWITCCTWFTVHPKAKSHRSDTKINGTRLLNFTLKKGKIKDRKCLGQEWLPHAEHIINHKAFRTAGNPGKPPCPPVLKLDWELEEGSQGRGFSAKPLSSYTRRSSSDCGRLLYNLSNRTACTRTGATQSGV